MVKSKTHVPFQPIKQRSHFPYHNLMVPQKAELLLLLFDMGDTPDVRLD
jgi:hypothetical protein